MCFMRRTALVFLLELGTLLVMGCNEKSTGPESPPARGMKHLWSNRFGSGGDQYPSSIAVDNSENIVVAGYFGYYGGTVIDFGGGALTSAGGNDIFIAKFSSDGAHLWSKRFGDANSQRAVAVTIDASGNIIVTGCFRGTVDFGGGALASAGWDDVFVAKFGPDGAHIWSKGFGDGSFQLAHAIATDALGDIIVAGSLEGTIDFGGGMLTSAGSSDICLAKFGPDGAHLWSKRFGDGNPQYARHVVVDASGNVIVTGSIFGTADFGGGPLTSAGSEDVFVAKFESDGAHLWSKRFGDRYSQYARAIGVDASSSVIVTGYFLGTVDFGGGALTSAGSADVSVAKFGSDGAHIWSKRFGDENYQEASTNVIDPARSVMIAGRFSGTIDFGGGALTSAGGDDIFIAKFSSDGAQLWSKRFGDESYQDACAIAVDPSGNVIVIGRFRGTIDFGGGALTSAGSEDIFIVKFRG